MRNTFRALALAGVATLGSSCIRAETTPKVAEPRLSMLDPARSIVVVHADGVDVDWNAPWASGKAWTRTLTGVVVKGREVLIAGSLLRNSLHITVQKPGSGARRTAKVAFFDEEAGLALLTVDDPGFWEDTPAAILAPKLGGTHQVDVLHPSLEGGAVESSEGNVSALEVYGRCDTVELKLPQADLKQRISVTDAVSVGGQIVGLVIGVSNGAAHAVGSPTLIAFLNAASHPHYGECATADLLWQQLPNPALRASLGLKSDEGGILVSEVWTRGSSSGSLKPGDVVLSVADTQIDTDGTYLDTDSGRLSFLALFSQNHRAGDRIPVELLRAGQRATVEVTLKRWPRDEALVPSFGSPSNGFIIQGGLVFERLTREYLELFGQDWETSAPPRLLEPYELERWASSSARPEVVVLKSVLPVPATLGYEHLANLVVDQINGIAIRSMEHVRTAFAHPSGGFHVVTFAPGQAVQRIVLDVRDAQDADASTRAQYH